MNIRHHTTPFDYERGKWLTREAPQNIRNWQLPRARAFSKAEWTNSLNEGKYPLDMVVAYEDSIARKRAIRLHGDLVADLQDKHDLQSAWWKFSFLREPEMFNRAVEDAVNAEMIVLAIHGDHELPEMALKWIDQWKSLKDGNHCALVALVDEVAKMDCAQNLCSQTRYLGEVAKFTQMTFFSKLFAAEKPHPPGNSRKASQRIDPGVQLLLNDLLNNNSLPEPGGINE